MTNVEIVNRVLRRLRESEVSSINANSYSALIAEFVEMALQDAWDRHPVGWSKAKGYAYRLNSAGFYDIENLDAGESTVGALPEQGRFELAKIRNPYNGKQVFEVYATDVVNGPTAPYPDQFSDIRVLVNASAEVVENVRAESPSTTWPQYFYAKDTILRADNDDKALLVGYYNRPTFDDVNSVADYDDVVPASVVIDGALFYALNERGEEIGQPGSIAETRYQTSLYNAIDRDMMHNDGHSGWGFSNDEIWRYYERANNYFTF